MAKLKTTVLQLLKTVGHIQTQILLGVLFFLILTPYALMLRLFLRKRFLGCGEWQEVNEPSATLEQMRRSF